MRLRDARRTPGGCPSRSRPACSSASARRAPSGSRRVLAIRVGAPRPSARPGGDRPELPGQAAAPRWRRRRTPIPTTSSRPSRSRGCCSGRRCGCRCRRTSPTPSCCRACVAAGIDDWGGVSPLTPDHVNPERPWPHLTSLADADRARRASRCASGSPSIPRTCGRGAVGRPAGAAARRRAAPTATGLAARGRAPDGSAVAGAGPRVWSAGRVDLHAAIDGDGRRATVRGDLDSAFGTGTRSGDDAVRDRPRRSRAAERTGPLSPTSRGSAAGRARPVAPARPAARGAGAGAAVAPTGRDLDAVARWPTRCVATPSGTSVTYVVNRNINFTNICYTGCRFCAFAQRRTDRRRVRAVGRRRRRRGHGRRGSSAPPRCACRAASTRSFPPSHYARPGPGAQGGAARAARARLQPDGDGDRGGASRRVHRRSSWPTLQEAGLDSLPGTAAEILDDDVRWMLTKGKLPTRDLGRGGRGRAPAGPADQQHHDVRPRRPARPLADPPAGAGAGAGPAPAGFTEFVPLPFVHRSAPLYLAGHRTRRSDPRETAGRARGGAAAAPRSDRPRADLVGQARGGRGARRCSARGPTTSAAR